MKSENIPGNLWRTKERTYRREIKRRETDSFSRIHDFKRMDIRF
jgi:hypothetical protein